MGVLDSLAAATGSPRGEPRPAFGVMDALARATQTQRDAEGDGAPPVLATPAPKSVGPGAAAGDQTFTDAQGKATTIPINDYTPAPVPMRGASELPQTEVFDPQQAIHHAIYGHNEENAPDMAYKISPEFRTKVGDVAKSLDAHPNDLLAAMHFETGGTFKSDVKNAAGSGAVGLLQFMPSTLRAMGTTPEKAAAMSQEQQLGLVQQYLAPYKGKLNSLSDVYMAVLWPKAVGKDDNYVLFSKDDANGLRYVQNKGLDLNKDGVITKAEATQQVRASAKRAGE